MAEAESMSMGHPADIYSLGVIAIKTDHSKVY